MNSEEDAMERPSFSMMQGIKRKERDDSDNDSGDEMDASKFIKLSNKAQMQTSSVVDKMMAKMGYTEGKGLGKHGQGRQDIVEASKQRGRRGLGHKIEGFEPADVEWKFEKEKIIIDEEVEWILAPSSDEAMPTLEEMLSWKEVMPKKRTIDDETTFCDERALKNILSSKSVFDSLDPEEMRRARTRSNPYETIRGAFFLNRAAMKMANMDAVLDFMFTNPKDSHGRPMVGGNELLYFADICAGPGGFSEYVLWRKKGDCKGFGLTLRGQNDFKLEDFFAGPSEMFEPHYGVGGVEGDGDIFRPDNQAAFINFVHNNTDGKGVHFCMADGGFSVEGQENIQEILSKQLYLCQFLVGVSVLREGGHFVCKLFDLFTPFSVGLVYLMRLIFNQVSIFKPVTSRPANSERYIVCKGLRPNKKAVLDYMDSINRDLCRHSSAMSTTDVYHIVPLDRLCGDEVFFTYIYNSNVKLGKQQIINLRKIQTFARNVDLYEARQADVRRQLLEKWKVPDEVRTAPMRQEPRAAFEKMVSNEKSQYEDCRPTELEKSNLTKIESVYDYMCVVSGDLHRSYLLSCGKSQTFHWDGRSNSRWRKLDNIRVELPTQTLLEVEFVEELKGEGKGQRRMTTVHVMDALYLCGKDIRQKHFRERQDHIQKFVKAVHKETRYNLARLVMPDVFRLEDASHIFDRLEMKAVKGSANQPRLCFRGHSGNFFHPVGIDLVKTVKEPWSMAMSKKAQRKYWFNKHEPNSSTFECHVETIATFRDSKMSQLRWTWLPGVKVHDSQQHTDESKVSRDMFVEHIQNKLK
ncbi:cap-specific mRNA (nucleoside-2'-O-)-methyltransferase 1-like isoform X2 [Babylonia areolata]|uniref:cap-specific mRNA (nucleoside-2'-O-)-methyltransferase 1-like isoform X2 n=1 Tax=Babylonia areolata TaxID=304850 RepID=UPI003FD53F68